VDESGAGKSEVEAKELSSHDLNRKRVYENMIEEAAMAPFKVGEALKGIRDERLFRSECNTFEQYANDKWGIGRARAYQLILAHETLQNLKGCPVLPTNEKQVRALIPLGGPLQKETWEKCVEQSPEVTITGDLVKTFVSAVLNEKPTAPAEKEKPPKEDVIIGSDVLDVSPTDDENLSPITKKQFYDVYNLLHGSISFIKENDYELVPYAKIKTLIKNLIDLLREEE